MIFPVGINVGGVLDKPLVAFVNQLQARKGFKKALRQLYVEFLRLTFPSVVTINFSNNGAFAE